MTTIEKTAPLQADALRTGDLILCGIRFREVLSVEPRSEDEDGRTTEFFVTVGGKDRSRRMTLTADLTVTIRTREDFASRVAQGR